MVFVRPPAAPTRIVKYLKPYVLKIHLSNKYITAQVFHTPTATVVAAVCSQEQVLRTSMESTRDVSAAGKVGKILGQRLLFKDIPAVSVFMKSEQKYHGKVKAVIDGVRDSGIKLL